MSQLTIAHWNDVYRVRPQKISPNGDTIDVTQFAALLDNVRSKWPVRSDGAYDGLSFFSGDLFSPSVDSTVTRGSHLVPVMNELAPDAAVAGNHEFAFGYPHLAELIKDAKYPWLLSNIIDANTNDVPEQLQLFTVLERSGIKVGVIGLVEQDWVSTIPAWPDNFKFKDMVETGKALSQQLRGEHQCDLVIALTHCRVQTDLQLARDLLALSPSAAKNHPIAAEHGVDIILGGHDHDCYVTAGVTSWEGYDTSNPIIGVGEESSDVLVVKSGTDFRELSEFTLELEDTPPVSIRKKVIKNVTGKRHITQPASQSSEKMKKILDSVLSSISGSLEAPVCVTQVELNLQSKTLRTSETAGGNWFADVLRHAYDDALQSKYGGGSDLAIISTGTLRGDTIYPAGVITLGNILEIFPFDDSTVVLELDGETLWDALEAALSKYSECEGRFPVVSGIRVSWDSRRPSGQRVLDISLIPESGTDSEPIKREKNGRTYKVVVQGFMAAGRDGYTALAGRKYLIDDEHGEIPSTLVRKYLLGSHYVNKMARLDGEKQDVNHLHSGTADVVQRAIKHRDYAQEHHAASKLGEEIEQAVSKILHQLRSRTHYVDHFNVSAREHMSEVDSYDGKNVRQGNDGSGENNDKKINKDDLLVIHPVVDGRLKDVARN